MGDGEETLASQSVAWLDSEGVGTDGVLYLTTLRVLFLARRWGKRGKDPDAYREFDEPWARVAAVQLYFVRESALILVRDVQGLERRFWAQRMQRAEFCVAGLKRAGFMQAGPYVYVPR